MKTGLRLPLRTLLPLLLLVLLGLQGLYLGWYTQAELKRTLVSTAHSDMRFLLSRMQGTLDYLASTEQYDQIHAELTGLGSDYTLETALLINEHNLILASLRLADLTRHLNKVIPAGTDRDYLYTQIDAVRTHRQGQIWLNSAGHLTAAYPIQLGAAEAELRPHRLGVLIVSRNLEQPYREVGRRVFDLMLPVAIVMSLLILAFGIALHWLVTRRMRMLASSAEQAAQGRYVQHIDIKGRDEIAQLARALENMFQKIATIQMELKLSERRYAQTQRAGNVGSWDWDIPSNHIHWSDTCEQLFGYDRGSFPGSFEGFISRVHPKDRPSVEHAVEVALKTNTPYALEYRLQLPDNTLRWIRAEGEVQRDTGGEARRMFGTVHDITQQKLAEQALRNSEAELRRHRDRLEDMVLARTAELEGVITELESFSYSVSHDLRAPLRAIAGFSDVLLEDYADILDDNGRHYLDRIRNGADRMGHLIDDLLNLSRVTRDDLKREPTDIQELVDDVIKQLRRENPGSKAEFICQFEGLEPIKVDQRLTRILLTNLLANAMKFSARQPQPRIECGLTTKQRKRVFYIRDNGVGFDTQYADKLFAPFQRLHNPADFEGTGIGLATAHRIIRRHGGRIWADSKPGQGAVFYFHFGRDNDDGSSKPQHPASRITAP